MKNSHARPIVFFLFLVIVVGNLIIVSEISASSEGNPYDTSQFMPLGYLGLKPDIHDTEMIYLRSSGIWIEQIAIKDDDKLLYSNESIDYTFTGPKFSPDGEKIVFTEIGRYGVFLKLLVKNGTNWDENVTIQTVFQRPKFSIEQPSFSPNGKKIVHYSNEAGGKGDVWVMDIDGTNRTRLTFDEDGGYYPSYSADGEKIIYGKSNSRGYHEIWAMDSDGSIQKRILDDSWYPEHPVFMPDGKVLFDSARVSPHCNKVGAPSIWMMEQDGSNRTLLVPSVISSLGSMNPSINRNGTRILFEHGIGDGQDLYIVDDPDGDGEWEDSDGDHVADICDGHPFDPDRGYIKDDDDDFIRGFSFESVAGSVFIAIPIVLWGKRSK